MDLNDSLINDISDEEDVMESALNEDDQEEVEDQEETENQEDNEIVLSEEFEELISKIITIADKYPYYDFQKIVKNGHLSSKSTNQNELITVFLKFSLSDEIAGVIGEDRYKRNVTISLESIKSSDTSEEEINIVSVRTYHFDGTYTSYDIYKQSGDDKGVYLKSIKEYSDYLENVITAALDKDSNTDIEESNVEAVIDGVNRIYYTKEEDERPFKVRRNDLIGVVGEEHIFLVQRRTDKFVAFKPVESEEEISYKDSELAQFITIAPVIEDEQDALNYLDSMIDAAFFNIAERLVKDIKNDKSIDKEDIKDLYEEVLAYLMERVDAPKDSKSTKALISKLQVEIRDYKGFFEEEDGKTLAKRLHSIRVLLTMATWRTRKYSKKKNDSSFRYCAGSRENVGYTLAYALGKISDDKITEYTTKERILISDEDSYFISLTLPYDESGALKMYSENSYSDTLKKDSFEYKIASTVVKKLKSMGAMDIEVGMDSNGIVKYEYSIKIRQGADIENSTLKRFGYVGQIYRLEDEGYLIYNKSRMHRLFKDTPQNLFIPSYSAYLDLPHKENIKNHKGEIPELTRLVGYTDKICDVIRACIEQNVFSDISLMQLYLRNDDKTAIEVISSVNKCTLNSMYRSTVMNSNKYEKNHFENLKKLDDNEMADYIDDCIKTMSSKVTYMRRYKEINKKSSFFMSVIGEESDGYFDKILTGSSENQGIIRYLVEGAKVNPDGSIQIAIKDGKKNIFTNITSKEMFKYCASNSIDRLQMSASNLLKAQKLVTARVRQLAFGGWTFDDAYVISKEWAQKAKIYGADGKIRPLTIGDKLCDMSGNKGVISLIVDRDLSMEDAKKLNLEKEIKWFKDHKDVDVIGSPYTYTRFNGGTAKELIEKNGHAQFIICDSLADNKNHVYEEDDEKQRSCSAMLRWQLDCFEADGIIDEVYKDNDDGFKFVQDVVFKKGRMLTNDGYLCNLTKDNIDKYKKSIRIIDLEKELKPDNIEKFNNLDVDDLVSTAISDYEEKDIITLIKLPTKDNNAKYVYLSCYEEFKFEMKGMFSQELSHFTVKDRYRRLLTFIKLYYLDSIKLNGMGTSSQFAKREKMQRKIEADLQNIKREKNTFFDSTHKLFGSNSVFKNKLMASNFKTSATLLWTPDPRLSLDTIGMSKATAKKLNIKDGDAVLMWRDPLLRSEGIKMEKVEVSDERYKECLGIAINPICDKPFDGDFDGDTVGLAVFSSLKANDDLLKFSWEKNLLDYRNPASYDESFLDSEKKQELQLVFNTGLEFNRALIDNKEFVEILQDIRTAANSQDESVVIDGNTYAVLDAMKVLADKVFAYTFGKDELFFDSEKAYMDSLSKVSDVREDGEVKLKFSTYKDYYNNRKMDSAFYLRAMAGTQFATAIRAFGTAYTGIYSQKGVARFRNEDPERLRAILELTSGVTQFILQSKHDPDEAKALFKRLKKRGKEIWSASPKVEEYIEKFAKFYVSKEGFNQGKVNVEMIKLIANTLCKETYVDDIFNKTVVGYRSNLDYLSYVGRIDEDMIDIFNGEREKKIIPKCVNKYREFQCE